MAKAKKTDTPMTDAPVVAAAAVDVVPAKKAAKAPKAEKAPEKAPKAEKAEKAVKAEKTEKTEKAEKAPKAPKKAKGDVTLVKNEIITDDATTESADTVLTDTFSQFLGKLQTLASAMNSLKSEFRLLEKKASRELKAAQKINAKRKRKVGNRSPSGFVKPTLISDELATFLQKPIGSEMARTEVTREINGYIRAHDLQDKANGRKINPDTPLAALLKIGSGDELTYFNLQRYMSPHFAKSAPKVAAA